MLIRHENFGTFVCEIKSSFIIYGGVELRTYNAQHHKYLTVDMINTVNLNLIKRR